MSAWRLLQTFLGQGAVRLYQCALRKQSPTFYKHALMFVNTSLLRADKHDACMSGHSRFQNSQTRTYSSHCSIPLTFSSFHPFYIISILPNAIYFHIMYAVLLSSLRAVPSPFLRSFRSISPCRSFCSLRPFYFCPWAFTLTHSFFTVFFFLLFSRQSVEIFSLASLKKDDLN